MDWIRFLEGGSSFRLLMSRESHSILSVILVQEDDVNEMVFGRVCCLSQNLKEACHHHGQHVRDNVQSSVCHGQGFVSYLSKHKDSTPKVT